MINVLYEDNHLLVVEKPAGILSQEDATKDPDMLTICKNYIKEKYNKPGNVFLALVQRLDRMTGGIMVFAKTSKAASRLSNQIRNHDVVKKYYCLVSGELKTSGTLKNYLKKDDNLVKSFVSAKEEGKLAVLDYQVIKKIDDISLVDVTLHTGRHHQIRVQFSNIGCPLVGDVLYGSNYKENLYLHAYYLAFVHPITGATMQFTLLPKGSRWDNFL